MPLSTIFQLYCGVSFTGGGNRRTRFVSTVRIARFSKKSLGSDVGENQENVREI